MIAIVAFLAGLLLLLLVDANAMSGVILGYCLAFLADGAYALVGHWRRTKPPQGSSQRI